MSHGKIIVLTHEFSPFRGGAATYAEELAAAIFELGHAVELWAPDYGRKNGFTPSSFPVVRLRSGGRLHFLDMIEYTRALGARIHALEQATVIPVSVGAHMALMILARLRNIRCDRIVSVLHGSEVLRFCRNPLWRWVARKFFRCCVDRVATVSQFSRSLIVQSRLLSAGQPILIAPGACSSAAKKETGAPTPREERVNILTLARVHPRKGQLDVAQALARLPAETRTKIQYQIAGAGDEVYLQKIERACRESGVPFIALGEIAPDRLPAIYQQCDIYAMTSRRLPRSVEGFGITYLEAGYHGKPVVAYDCGGASEAVLDQESGLLVAEGDTSALTEAFARLIAAPELRQRLGEGGRRNAARFDWEMTAQILLQS